MVDSLDILLKRQRYRDIIEGILFVVFYVFEVFTRKLLEELWISLIKSEMIHVSKSLYWQYE